jgi:hypothetical protein
MNLTMRKTILITILMILSGLIWAQESSLQVISASGTDFSGENYSISYTLGEPIYTTLVSDDYVLTQGFHQTSYTVTRLDQYAEEELDIQVYPNPTTRFLNVVSDNSNYSCLLFDMSGRIIAKENVTSGSITLDLAAYSEGAYYLNIIDSNGKSMAKYKIVKNK